MGHAGRAASRAASRPGRVLHRPDAALHRRRRQRRCLGLHVLLYSPLRRIRSVKNPPTHPSTTSTQLTEMKTEGEQRTTPLRSIQQKLNKRTKKSTKSIHVNQ